MIELECMFWSKWDDVSKAVLQKVSSGLERELLGTETSLKLLSKGRNSRSRGENSSWRGITGIESGEFKQEINIV